MHHIPMDAPSPKFLVLGVFFDLNYLHAYDSPESSSGSQCLATLPAKVVGVLDKLLNFFEIYSDPDVTAFQTF
jgi:hypothetical protein